MYHGQTVKLLNSFPDLLTFDELVEVLGIGINTTYDLLRQKKIYSKKIGKEYKIPRICVTDYLYNQRTTDFSTFLNEYGDVLDYKEVRKILRNPSRNILYKILKNNEIYFIMIASQYKIPKSSLMQYIFSDYT